MMPFEDHEHDRYGLRAGDVVVCEGGEAGRAAIWDGRIPGMKFQKAIHRVRPNKHLDARYLVHRLRSDYLNGTLADYYTGATIKHLTGQDLSRYRFPLPPIGEQRRIAEILDKADALRAKRQAALAHLDTLTQSIFLDMFGDPEANANRWPTVSLSKCTSLIQIGPFGSLLHQEDYVQNGVPLVNPKHIHSGQIKPDAFESVTPQKADELSAYRMRTGDVLMGRRGEMGRCAVVGPEHDGLLCGTGSIILRPDLVRCSSVYLSAMLAHPSMRRRMERQSLGTTLPNLNRTIVANFEVPLAPLKIQVEYQQRVAVLESIRREQVLHGRDLDGLFSALQHRAFRGEL